MERSFVDSLDSLYQPQLSLNLNLLSTHHHHHHRQRGLYHSPSRRPFEVDARPADEAEYERYRRLTDLGEPYRLPRALLAGTKPGAPAGAGTPEAPLLVLINSRAGGRAGPRLTKPSTVPCIRCTPREYALSHTAPREYRWSARPP